MTDVKFFWNGHNGIKTVSSDTIESTPRILSYDNITLDSADKVSSAFNTADRPMKNDTKCQYTKPSIRRAVLLNFFCGTCSTRIPWKSLTLHSPHTFQRIGCFATCSCTILKCGVVVSTTTS